MSEEVPKVKRTKAVPQKRVRKSGAAAEIDKRIAEAIREKTQAMKDISLYVMAQDRHMRLTQEINELLGMQARMNGSTSADLATNGSNGQTAIPFSVGGMAPGAASIPAKNVPNIAEKVAAEGGFS